jgi:hypothetical protein
MELMETATSVPLLQRKIETANFCLFAANGKGIRKFVFHCQQTINGNRRLLFQQKYPSIGFI